MLTPLHRKLFNLSKLKGIGPAALRKFAAMPGIERASEHELAASNKALAKALEVPGAWAQAIAAADADLKATEVAGAHIVCALDEAYPALLKAASYVPFFLYAKGAWPAVPSQTVAVVGTREPTEHGRLVTQRMTAFLAQRGWSIVSGLALGCDALAHQAALDCGAHTIAVLAHGLHTVAPKQHQQLAAQIVEAGGLLVTEYGFGEDAKPPYFVQRDRIQAGLSCGVVMIQSDRQGGSLHASRAALADGRLLAVPVATERDAANGEPKVAANQLLAHGSDDELSDFLQCEQAALQRLCVIRGKEDYAALVERLSAVQAHCLVGQFGGTQDLLNPGV